MRLLFVLMIMFTVTTAIAQFSGTVSTPYPLPLFTNINQDQSAIAKAGYTSATIFIQDTYGAKIACESITYDAAGRVTRLFSFSLSNMNMLDSTMFMYNKAGEIDSIIFQKIAAKNEEPQQAEIFSIVYTNGKLTTIKNVTKNSTAQSQYFTYTYTPAKLINAMKSQVIYEDKTKERGYENYKYTCDAKGRIIKSIWSGNPDAPTVAWTYNINNTIATIIDRGLGYNEQYKLNYTNGVVTSIDRLSKGGDEDYTSKIVFSYSK